MVALSVLIVNSDAYELATLTAAMRLHGISVVGETRSLKVATNLIRTLDPKTVLIDLNVAREEALVFAKTTRNMHPLISFVIMVNCPDLRLLGLKLNDFPLGSKLILKRSVAELSVISDSIESSVISTTAGEKVSWINRHQSLYENSFATVLTDFTDIQIETLRLVARGLTNAEIGRVRFVSEKSVEQIVARIAQHFNIAYNRRRNPRVLLTGEYFKCLGAPFH